MQSATPLATSTRYRGHVLGIFMLALFFAMHNISVVFYQLRGVPSEHAAGSMAGFYLGIALGAALMTFLERRAARGLSMAAPRAFLFIALLLPAALCLFSFRVTGFRGNAFLNFFQPLLWALPLPVALRFFFLHVRPAEQALYFGVAIEVGHLCWALLVPLAQLMGGSGGIEPRLLAFLNLTRILVAALLAVFCWRLSAYPLPGRAATVETGEKPSPRCLLVPLAACYFLSGFLGYLFFARLWGRRVYPEYLHLTLTVFFPVLGLLCYRPGLGVLRHLLGGAALCFAAVPLLLFLPQEGGVTKGVYFACAASQQLLLYGGTLALSRYAPSSRYPAFTLSAAWLISSAGMAGNVTASRLLPLLPLSTFGAVCALAALCALSVLCLGRAFPLPDHPGHDDAPEDGVFGRPFPETLRLQSFAREFTLTAREREVLECLLRENTVASAALGLGVSENTVKFHVRSLLKKTGNRNRQRLLGHFSTWTGT